MSVMWNYVNKREATVNAIKDYYGMHFIIDTYHDDLKQTRNKMVGLSSPHFNPAPSSSSKGNPTEQRLVNGIVTTDKLNERYHSAKAYLDWFEPAWQELSEDERWILTTFYLDKQTQTGAVLAIQERFCIERTSAYNKKNRALDHLTLLLYGGH